MLSYEGAFRQAIVERGQLAGYCFPPARHLEPCPRFLNLLFAVFGVTALLLRGRMFCVLDMYAVVSVALGLETLFR